MGKARGGVDLVVGVVAVVVIAWIALKAVGFVLGTVFFALKVIVALAIVGAGLAVLNRVLERREVRAAGGGRQLRP